MYRDFYVLDILGRSKKEVAQNLRYAYTLMTGLGFIINEGKFQLTPSQEITSLGADIVLQRGIAVSTRESITNQRRCVKLFLSIHATQARTWLELQRFMANLVGIVPWCRLNIHSLQIHLGPN